MLVENLGNDRVDGFVKFGPVLRGARDDQRRPRLVDQDRVDLVHDRKVMIALGHIA